MQRDLITSKMKRVLIVSAILFAVLISLILLSSRQPDGGIFSRITRLLKPSFSASLQVDSAIKRGIEFRTYNGEESEKHTINIRQIPHLVLLRNGKLTEPRERSVSVILEDFNVPVTAWALDIILETQSGDPDAGGGAMNRIQVQKSRLHLPEDKGKRDRLKGLRFLYTLGSESELNSEDSYLTPSGYYRISVNYVATKNGEERHYPVYEEDYAFLMESQWVVDLPLEIGDPAGAGPRELIVYYMDMTPFQSDTFTVEGRFARQAVHPYIKSVVVPGMVGIIKHETQQWGFSWSADWRGYRPGEDQNRISVALTDQKEWFHGRAPKGGYATLSINVHQLDLDTYLDVTDWILSIFSHELFHNHQRNLSLLHQGDGEPEGSKHAWKIVTEGTALLIESLMRNYLGTVSGIGDDPYTARLRTYLAGTSMSSSKLNTSITQLSPYEMVVYWRFLYENCQPARAETLLLGQGLGIIRQTLDTLYADAEILNASLEEVPASFARLMDRVFANSQLCPYTSFRESLASFARSLYSLRFAEPECGEPAGEESCHRASTQPAPPAVEMKFTGSPLTIEDQISSSYGIDFYEIHLQGVDAGTIQLDFQCLSGGVAAYQVELVALDEVRSHDEALVPTNLSHLASAGSPLSVATPCPDNANDSKLGVLITRVDAEESADPVGRYRLTIAIEQ